MGQNETVSQDFSMQGDKSYDEEKREKKQKIVRNEFPAVGKYGMPFIKKQNIDIKQIELWSIVKAKLDDYDNAHKTIHFFTYDWLYETVYTKPETALEKLDQYYALLTPDFSCYFNMPLALQIYSTFKNRWCGAFWQKQGMRVIPTIEWGDEKSFEFCFDGIEQGAVVAVSTYRREGYQKEFLQGFNAMMETIKPSAVICYGEPFNGMTGNIKVISPFNHEELIKKLGLKEYVKKLIAGEVYPSN
ncbi:MAG: DUF4417 domain-containing protein [Firmicutes bacterium]|nr:DUF4417 domain-containing protein [Bacillota bacterium]